MKKFENFVIVTDLDGTFFGRKIKAVPRNIEKIKYFTENGGRFTAATGRVAIHALVACPVLREIINLPMIACNGTMAYDAAEDKLVKNHPMDYEIARRIADVVHKSSDTAGARASMYEGFIATERDMISPLIRRDIELSKNGLVLPIEEWRDISVYKFAVRDEEQRIPELRELIAKRLSDIAEVTQSYGTIIDIQAKGYTKAAMTKKVVNDYVGKDAVVFACGDYDNDIEMLRIADVAVCPSNAVDSVKAVSDLCLCDCDEGLIGALIDEIENGIFE